MSVMDYTEWDSEKEKASKQMLMKSNEILLNILSIHY